MTKTAEFHKIFDDFEAQFKKDHEEEITRIEEGVDLDDHPENEGGEAEDLKSSKIPQ